MTPGRGGARGLNRNHSDDDDDGDGDSDDSGGFARRNNRQGLAATPGASQGRAYPQRSTGAALGFKQETRRAALVALQMNHAAEKVAEAARLSGSAPGPGGGDDDASDDDSWSSVPSEASDSREIYNRHRNPTAGPARAGRFTALLSVYLFILFLFLVVPLASSHLDTSL
jgi:hypothetical protein